MPRTMGDDIRSGKIYGVPISEDTDTVRVEIPRSLAERWQKMLHAKVKADWNKKTLVGKMIFGFLMEGECMRYFLIGIGIELMLRYVGLFEVVSKRVVDERGVLSKDELATFEELNIAFAACGEMMKSLQKITVLRQKKPKASENAAEELPKIRIPRFYAIKNIDPNTGKQIVPEIPSETPSIQPPPGGG
jgi:hypothetical protein